MLSIDALGKQTSDLTSAYCSWSQREDFSPRETQSAEREKRGGKNEETDEREFKRRHKRNVIKVASVRHDVLKNWCLREINFSLSTRTDR